MEKTNSPAGLRRERLRDSPETIVFKNKLSEFLTNAKPEISYAIKRDLACMTNMPFYKDRPKVMRLKMNPSDLICEYVDFFKTIPDKEFVIGLVKRLSTNQSQTLRKAAPRIGKKADVWEHAIPTKVIVDEIIEMIKNNDFTDLRRLLNVYNLAGQRGLTKDQNKLLDNFRSSMPPDWNWRHENIDPLVRHKHVGIDHK